MNISFTSVDRASKQKICKKTLVLNDSLGQMNLIDTYGIFLSKVAEYTFKYRLNIPQDIAHARSPKMSQ